jgi:predicted RNA-binding protein with PIN domain
MTNKIIIDAWNVCWKIPEIAEYIPDNLSLARKKFNLIIKNYFFNKKSVYKIIYDGQPGIIGSKHELKGQDIQFSRNPQSADQKILSFLKFQKNPSLWTVISSDRELTGRAKNAGVNVVSSEQFISKLQKTKVSSIVNSKKENPNLSKNEINDWLELFNNQK